MNNNYVFYDGEEYLIEDGNISKIVNGEACMPSKREMEDVEDFLEQNILFASSELNNIALANIELYKCDILVDVINVLNDFIPDNLKTNFYNNLKTLKVNIGYECSNEYINPCYDATDNILLFPSSKLKKIKEAANSYNNSKEVYNAYLFHILLHEMLHLSSTDRTKVESEDYYLNNYSFFKEGMTESITAMLSSNSDAYVFDKKAIKQLSILIPFEVIVETYFKDLEIDHLIDELNKILFDSTKAKNLFDNLEEGCSKLIDKRRRSNLLLNAQNDLLDYINIKCYELENNCQLSDLDDSLKILNENYYRYEELSSLKVKSNNSTLLNNDFKLEEINNKYNKHKQLSI